MTILARAASHRLVDDETIRSVPGACPFDRIAYSMMKHGGRRQTDRFALDLYRALRDDGATAGALLDHRPPVFLVAYRAVVPACFHLSERISARNNLERERLGLAPGRLAKVDKDSVTVTDYATASAADRRHELDAIHFTLPALELDDANVIVVDDIRVTGAAEETMTELLRTVPLARLTLGYVITVEPGYAAGHPEVERALNSAAVGSILDLVEPFGRGDIAPTIRLLKMVLGSDAGTLRDFLDRVGVAVACRLLAEAVATGPSFVTAQRAGVGVLQSYLAGEVR